MDREELRVDAGQMILAGFHGTTLPDGHARRLAEGHLAGVVLFARNLGAPEDVLALNRSILAAVPDGPPLPFIAVDQEGGRVQRLREPLCRIPPMEAVGTVGDSDLAARLGSVVGSELGVLGFNLDFAPCADLRTNPENDVIGDRSFGADPEKVARLAGAFAAGITMEGLIPCFKHFPGHGDTVEDSHYALPLVEHEVDTLRERELRVFELLFRASAPMLMTAHLMVPAIDTRHPFTLSEQGVTQLLRRRMRYGGVVISDDLEMLAIADHYSPAEIAELGLFAGLDLLMFCHSEDRQIAAWEALVRLGESSAEARERIATAAGRVRFLKRDYLRRWSPEANWQEVLGCDAHQRVVDEVWRRSGAHP